MAAQPVKKGPKFVKKGMTVRARLVSAQPICMELYKSYPQLGRFSLRDEGKTICVGVIVNM